MATPNFKSVDQYIASLPDEAQAILRKIRQIVRDVAPDAVEKISYQMPSYTLDGAYLLYFAAWKKHIAVYGLTGALDEFRTELASYMTEKGTLKFPLDHPFPYPLMRKILKFNVKAARGTAKVRARVEPKKKVSGKPH